MLKSPKSKILNKFITLPSEKEKYEPDEDTIKLLSKKWNINILSNIGYGGFSIVKLVHNENTNQYYACKIVKIYYINNFRILNLGQYQKRKVSFENERTNREIPF